MDYLETGVFVELPYSYLFMVTVISKVFLHWLYYNCEEKASELFENLEEMFHQYYMLSDDLSIFKYLTLERR